MNIWGQFCVQINGTLPYVYIYIYIYALAGPPMTCRWASPQSGLAECRERFNNVYVYIYIRFLLYQSLRHHGVSRSYSLRGHTHACMHTLHLHLHYIYIRITCIHACIHTCMHGIACIRACKHTYTDINTYMHTYMIRTEPRRKATGAC